MSGAAKPGTPAAAVRQISAARWSELYCEPGSGYPGMETLARRFGVSDTTIKRCLQAAGIQPRGREQQARIEFRRPGSRGRGALLSASRAQSVPASRAAPMWTPEARARWQEGYARAWRERGREWTERRAAGRRRGAHVPCAWCGAPVWRRPYQLRRDRFPCCDRSCLGRLGVHRRYRPDALRPAIVSRLHAHGRERPAGGRWDKIELLPQLERKGAEIGATADEVWEAFGQVLEERG
jgi:hypothetical protein